MVGDIVLQLRDARYPGQLEMRLAAADEIEALRNRMAVSALSQEDFSMLCHLADSMGFGRTHDALRRIIAALPYYTALKTAQGEQK